MLTLKKELNPTGQLPVLRVGDELVPELAVAIGGDVGVVGGHRDRSGAGDGRAAGGDGGAMR